MNVNAEIDDAKVAVLKRALSPVRVRFLEVTTRDAALQSVLELMSSSPCIQDPLELSQAILRREALMSTGIGLGLAVPHVRLSTVSDLTMAVGISVAGIADYPSLDDKPVHLIFLIAAHATQHTDYLRLLSLISSRAKALDGQLLHCADASTFCRALTLGQPVPGECGSAGV